MFLFKAPKLAACAVALLTLAPTADKVTFQPAEGAEMAKHFSISGDFQLGDISMVVDGNDMSGAIPADFSGSFGTTLSIVDHYVKTLDGKPLELVRDIEKSSSDFKMGETSDSSDDVFGLDGETVVYKWNEESKEYDRSFKDGEGDKDKLDELGVDLDYRGLLPEKDIAEGDTWNVERAGLTGALFFGADLSDVASKANDDPEFAEIADQVLPEIEKLFDGFKAQCTYAGAHDAEGVHLGEIKVTVDSDGSADLKSVLLSVIEKQAQGQDVQFDLETASLGVKLKGEGTLLWNLASHRVQSFDFSGEIVLSFELEASVDAPDGQNHSVEGSVELVGNAKWEMSGK